ncbi:MaoC family dehydratase [Ottowia sp.]|uniref:MaoC family dehydratase n=1 Tax=Ottowia sp. TaxID=1898956 RepID=UPI002C702B76|nr:MaoC family dehydratase [Ottowia sp.]HOB66939.1 MaoC family dehydratase [Ottowia sp.]HPZ58580.1 MaoC family dehydratase [Ottowia sp.]HQD47927.1 MaoC family dehydratase [Ottowia sp.]
MTVSAPSDHPQQHIKYFWEDLPVGTTLDIGSTTVDHDEVIAFASKYDPQPFHLSDEAAAKSIFGKLSASGWHTCAMAMGLMVRGFLHESSSLGSPGLEKIQWPTPVYPGDTLTLKQTITESRPMKSRPDVGLTRTVWEMFNQRGEQVLMMDGYGMFRRRTPAAPAVAG